MDIGYFMYFECRNSTVSLNSTYFVVIEILDIISVVQIKLVTVFNLDMYYNDKVSWKCIILLVNHFSMINIKNLLHIPLYVQCSLSR